MGSSSEHDKKGVTITSESGMVGKINAKMDEGISCQGMERSISATMKPYLTIFFGELIGTMILLFVGCGSIISFQGDPVTPHHLNAIGFGFAAHLAIQVFGHITACHINPGVSIVSLLLGFINISQFIIYVIAQFSGALLGFVLLKILFPENYITEGFCMTKITPGVTLVQAFFIEIVITCFLCFVICAVWDPRNETKADSTPIRFAIIISVLSIIAGPLTGASMNTARSFGPSIFGSARDWEDQWIYWVAPNISPFISVGLYKLLFSETKTKKVEKNAADEAILSNDNC